MNVSAENTTFYDYSSYYDSTWQPTPSVDEGVSSFGKVFLPVSYSLVFIVGFIGNGLVVCVLVRHSHRSNLTDMCLFNLAVSDLLFILTLPFYVHYSAISEWVFGDFMCHVSGGFHTVGFYSSTFFMVAMTIDRYALIQHAQKVAKYRCMKTGIVLSSCVWVLSLCASLPAFVFSKVTVNNNVTANNICTYNPESDIWIRYSIFATIILGLVIPFSVMVVCYSMIIPTLMKMRSAKKHRIVKLIIAIMIVFFLFWAPYNISLFLEFQQYESYDLSLSIIVTETIAYTHCCLNPIIYAFAGQRFMKRSVMMLRKLLPGIHCHSGRDISDSSFRRSSGISRTSVTSTVIM